MGLLAVAFVAARVPMDLGTLMFYPLMLTALVVAVRRHVRRLASPVWLDSAVGPLSAASVLAVLPCSSVRDQLIALPRYAGDRSAGRSRLRALPQDGPTGDPL